MGGLGLMKIKTSQKKDDKQNKMAYRRKNVKGFFFLSIGVGRERQKKETNERKSTLTTK